MQLFSAGNHLWATTEKLGIKVTMCVLLCRFSLIPSWSLNVAQLAAGHNLIFKGQILERFYDLIQFGKVKEMRPFPKMLNDFL